MCKSRLLGAVIVSVLTMAAHAQRVEDLDWLSGTWVGKFGPLELEETWNQPKSGSIQALVRMLNEGEMMMVELVVIEEHEDSLRLRFQQWGPGMEPGEYGRQSMRLVDSEDQMIAFEAEDEGPLEKLSYKRTQVDELEITVVNSEGQEHTMLLENSNAKSKTIEPKDSGD